jgi:hypothetical protein
MSARFQYAIESRIDLPGILFEHLFAHLVAQIELIYMAFGIILVVAGLRISAPDGTDHL